MFLLEFSAFAYLLVMLIISYGWYLSKVSLPLSHTYYAKVSVVVAVRNESQNIKDLLNSLMNQTYSKLLFEVIIVDDNSSDNTIEIINLFKKDNPKLNIVTISCSGHGKKEAIKQGIETANNDIIICTDGDCEVSYDWIRTYVAYFELKEVKLIFGAVFYSNSKSLLQNIFSLEFSTLVASGAGSAGIGLPLMANGANMAFKKDAYLEISNNIAGENYASGDDVFLLHSISKKYGSKSIKFLKNNNNIVETSAPETFKKFVNQRIRWGSKAKAYKNIWPLLVSMVVLIFNLLLGFTAILSFFRLWFFALFILLALLKFLIDFPLTNNFLRFFRRPKIAFLLLPLEMIYPFYIMITAVFSLFIPYQWKGRKRIK